MSFQSIPAPKLEVSSWSEKWLPLLAVAWMGAFLRVCVAALEGPEVLTFGLGAALVTVVIVPCVAWGTLKKLWRSRTPQRARP